MRNHLRLPTLALLAILIAACTGGTPSAAPASDGGAASAPAASGSGAPAASPSAPAAVTTPEPAADCAQSGADNAMEMWERSGGNKQMVDMLVAAGTPRTPTARST